MQKLIKFINAMRSYLYVIVINDTIILIPAYPRIHL